MATFKEIAAYSGATQYYTYDIALNNDVKWWAQAPSIGEGLPTENSFWTREWYFTPTRTQQVKREPKRLMAAFGEGYVQTTAVGMDFDHDMEFSFTWDIATDRETKAIIEFVKDLNEFNNTTTIVSDETLSGFWYNPPFPYTRYAGIYTISNYTTQFLRYNMNTLSLNLKLKNLQANP